MRRLLPVTAWLAVLGVLALAFVRPSADLLRRTGLERMRAVDLAEGVEFALDPDEERVKVLTWLARPSAWARDVRATTPYALRLEVVDPDDVVRLRRDVWLRTRQSWSLGSDGRLLRPSWLPGSEAELTDSRSTVLDLAGLLPEGGRVRVDALSVPDASRVLAVAYREAERTGAARLRFLAGGSPASNSQAAARVGVDSWSDLPEAWRDRLAQRVWERLSPLPTPGRGRVPAVELLRSHPEIPSEGQPALGLPVPPGGAIAYNVQRGATLTIRWLDVDGQGAAPAATWLQVVGADGAAELRFLGVVEEIGPLTITEPLQSVQIALDPGVSEPRLAQARVLAGAGVEPLWGDPPRLHVDGPPGAWRVAPDLRTLELVRLGPGLPPVRYPVAGDGETLRLGLRARLDGATLPALGQRWSEERGAGDPVPLVEGTPREVLVVARDAGDRELARWLTRIEARASAFERYTQGDDPATAHPGEPEQRFLAPPPGTAWIEVSATADVDVAVRARQPDGPMAQVARGYELPAALAPPGDAGDSPLPTWHTTGRRQRPELPRARYEPYTQDPWQARAPEDLEGLLREGRVVRLDAQVRLEPSDWWRAERWMARVPARQEPALPEAAPERGALPLPGAYTLIAEADRDGRAQRGARVRLGSGTATVTVPASGRLDIDYRVAADQVGEEVTLWVDGGERRERLWASAGRMRLAELSPGATVQLRVDQPGLFLARGQGSPLWQVRRVVMLEPDQRRTLELPGKPGSLAIMAYGAGGWLEWSLRGGQPSHQAGLLEKVTRRHGRQRLRSSGGVAMPLSRSGDGLPRLTPVVITLGEDLGGGPLALDLELRGAERPVWIRATATWTACPGGDCDAPRTGRATLGSR